MKTILLLAFLSFNASVLASEIKCHGQSTNASIYLDLTGRGFPINKAEYRYNNKLISTAGYEFGINNNKDNRAQKLTYKFKILKKHPLAQKNSDLVLTIKQVSTEGVPFNFILNDTNEAELLLEVDGSVILLDNMDCN